MSRNYYPDRRGGGRYDGGGSNSGWGGSSGRGDDAWGGGRDNGARGGWGDSRGGQQQYSRQSNQGSGGWGNSSNSQSHHERYGRSSAYANDTDAYQRAGASSREWFSNGANTGGGSYGGRGRYKDTPPSSTSSASQDPEAALLHQLLLPFRDTPPRLPPSDILSRITQLTSASRETPVQILQSSAASANFNPAAFRWDQYYSESLDRLLEAASSASSSAVKLESTRSRRTVAENLCRLCGVAQLAAKFGQATAATPTTESSKRETGAWTRKQTNKALDILYDYCEDGDAQVRIIGYNSLSSICHSDPSLIRRNADVLCQLLQVQEQEELTVVQRNLRELLQIDARMCLKTLLGEHTRDNADLRRCTLQFLMGEGDAASSETASETRKLLRDKLEGDIYFEADFAGWLSDLLHAIKLRPSNASGGDDAMDTSEAESSKDNKYAQSLPELQAIQQLLAYLPTIWLPASDFSTGDEHKKASKAAQKLMDALAVKSLEKMRALLQTQYDYLLFDEDLKSEHHMKPSYQKEVQDALSELEFFEQAADEAATKLADLAAKEKSAPEEGPATTVDVDMLVDSADPSVFVEQSFQNLLDWVCKPEFEWSEREDERAKATYDIQATYELFRSRLLAYVPAPKPTEKKEASRPPVRSLLSFFSPTLRPLLLRSGAIAALSRRKEAAAHGHPSAYDNHMSASLVAALVHAAQPPSVLEANVEPGVSVKDTDLVECADAIFWGLSMCLPLRAMREREPISIATDPVVVSGVIHHWSSDAERMLQNIRTSVKDKAYITSLLNIVLIVAGELSRPAKDRMPMTERPIWLPAKIQLVDQERIQPGSTPHLPGGAANGRSSLKRRGGEEENDGDKRFVSIRGRAAKNAASSAAAKKAKTYNTVAGRPVAVVSIRGTAASESAKRTSLRRPEARGFGAAEISIRGRNTGRDVLPSASTRSRSEVSQEDSIPQHETKMIAFGGGSEPAAPLIEPPSPPNATFGQGDLFSRLDGNQKELFPGAPQASKSASAWGGRGGRGEANGGGQRFNKNAGKELFS